MGGVYLGMLPGRLALVAQNSSGRWRCQHNSGSSFSNATSKHIRDFWEQSPPKKRYSLITWPCPAQTDNIAQHHSEHKTASALLEAEFTETPGLSYHFKKKKEIERTFSQWTSYKSVPVYTGHSVSPTVSSSTLVLTHRWGLFTIWVLTCSTPRKLDSSVI